jgi:pyruvate/2-oxoglutarate dehydrogenase complex dihydrolipoamide dehydrogenase (E3) component
MPKVRQRKRDIVTAFRDGSQRQIVEAGVDLIFGEASFSGAKSIVVAGHDGQRRALVADLIFINTGARPARPNLAGLDEIPWLDSTSVMELYEVPEHLLVLGGGYIGLEFGQLYRRLGSDVTMIQRGDRLLAREDVDVSTEVAKIMGEDGLNLVFEAEAQSVEQTNGRIRLSARTPSGERLIDGSHLLVAVGRTPNTEALNLAAAGIKTNERGEIVVNDRLETSAPGVYALGDVKGGPQFTHISYDDFRVIRANLIEGNDVTIRGRMVPYTIYIDPQLGRVGLTEAAAREQGRNLRVASMPMSRVARALETGESRGFMKAVVDGDTDEILGFAALGLEGGELMSLVEVAMMGQLPWQKLRNGIFAHPTLAESLNNLFATLDE